MPLRDLWPSFPASRILFEDEDLVAVDKPAGTSTHAPDAERCDDCVSRLGAAIAERDGVPRDRVYLGIHQRLDRDTSGVLVFTKHKRANAGLAPQFEKRTVEKTYVAGVQGWPAKLREGVMRHRLAREDAERMRVVRSSREKGQDAVTRYRVLERNGDRALLELVPETGRTHQIRVQIEAMGAAIAGDPVYGKVPAPRLMLHAARLRLVHPTTQKKLALEAKVPGELGEWLRGEARDPLADEAEVASRLRLAADRRYGLGRSDDTTAFRLANEAGDGVDGIAVDVYGEHLLVHLSSPDAEAARERILDAAWSLGPKGVYLMVHPKQASNLVDPRTEARAPSHAVRGEDAPSPLVVREAGLSYVVRLGDGLKTGIFLDQRENRRRLRSLAAGKRVLNLFAYTCAFTVAAAAGGASRTVSVDVTPGVLDWGRENLAVNGLAGEQHVMIAADALVWLRAAQKQKERFDVVVLDPPSFATTRTSRFSAESDYRSLAALALSVLAPGGRLLACTNLRGMAKAKLRRYLFEAGREAGRELSQVKDLPDPADFPPPPGGHPHLKSELVTLDARA